VTVHGETSRPKQKIRVTFEASALRALTVARAVTGDTVTGLVNVAARRYSWMLTAASGSQKNLLMPDGRVRVVTVVDRAPDAGPGEYPHGGH
jgi:hypothetical protein